MPSQIETDRKWMQMALEAARGAEKDLPIGSVLLDSRGELLACTHNLKEATVDATAHAEIVALRAGYQKLETWRLEGATLYTTLEPCPMCAEAILQSRVSRVVFGAYDALSGALGSRFNLYAGKRIYTAPEVLGGVLEAECAELVRAFFRG